MRVGDVLSERKAPRSKNELMAALRSASIRTVAVFEADELARLPSVRELQRRKASVIVIES